MKLILDSKDVLMSGDTLAALELDFSYADGGPVPAAVSETEEELIERLRRNPALAAELLSYDGPIIYMGEAANYRDADGHTLGMRFRDGGTAVEGDNVYGKFLMRVRNRFAELQKAERVEETLVRPGQVIVDFVPADAEKSWTEEQEDAGREFIHTEPYRPVRFRFDASRNGTTGYAGRQSGFGVSFQTFECPFGTDFRSRVRVSSAAEASLLYEKALRREIDWKSLFEDLSRRGLVKGLSPRQQQDLLGDLKAQFDWMREQICRNGRLKDLPVVASGMLVPDASFGRSVYDPDTAPSPAHILARYINNPLLLFSASENGVLRALDTQEKEEPYRFSAVSGGDAGRLTLVVDGSDTIGGRVPGTRAVREGRPVYARDNRGKMVYDATGKPVVARVEDAYRFQMKPADQVEAEYAVFRGRLSSILANISPEVEVRLVTGTGVGVPQMVSRFVQENGGGVADWDWDLQREKEVVKADGEQPRFSQLRVPHFQEAAPALSSYVDSVTLPDADDLLHNTLRSDYIRPRGWVTFSVAEDRRNSNILGRGSLAAAAGLPVVHVQENRSEDEQALVLATEASLSRDVFVGERTFQDSLFDGELREQWDVDGSAVMSYVQREDGIAIPQVAFLQDACVYVSSFPFHSVYSAYAAMLLREAGVTDTAAFRSLSQEEESMAAVAAAVADIVVDDAAKERCMRNAVHLMAQASSVFTDSLISTGEADIVAVSSFGDPALFVNLDGHGQNRFGVVLQAERRTILDALEARRLAAEAEARHVAEENVRLQRRANTQRAKGEKMTGGLPASVVASEDAVWLLGTDRPSQLCLPDDGRSFVLWEEREYGRDALNRELASRARLDDGEDGEVDNDFVFLFPSDQLAATGRRHVVNNPDSKNLTGVVRTNPRTGKEFVCAYGIPVKKDNLYFEFDNKLGRMSSFLSDRDSSSLVSAVVAADALARSTALQQGMALCYSARERSLPGGEENDDLTRVFLDKVWDYPRTKEVIDRTTGRTVSEGGAIMPVEVNKRVYNRETKKYELRKEEKVRRMWVDNPHAAPKLRAVVKRYEKMLDEGSVFPLNCICLPQTDYTNVPEEKFLADFSFALSVANATALATGKPMRFPLDEQGRLWVGPDVPEAYRDAAERKLDAFIGVVRRENIINEALPYIRRIPVGKSVRKDVTLKGDGSDLYIRPNDLLTAFGPFDFDAVAAGSVVPIHEMAFTMDDGTLFRVTNPRLTKGMQLGEINRYLRYDKNDECRFTVKSSDPDRIPEFLTALKSYLERAKAVSVETRLLSEEDARGRDMGLDGFIRLLSSNSDEIATLPEDVGARGDVSALELPNRFDGTDDDSVYYGKEEAKDAFAGYAQFRYTLPDGSQSDWVTVTDREIALDIIYSKVNRVYRSDVRVVPSRPVLEAEVRALAIGHAGERFRSLSQEPRKVEVDTKVVESERYVPGQAREASAPEPKESVAKGAGRVFVTYYGSRGVPEDAFKVQISTSCPPGMKEDMDVCFKSIYPDYGTMVDPHKKGEIDDREYSRRYLDKVLEPNKEKILSGMRSVIATAKEEGKDVYLYCYCKPGAFCHRYLVNNFLNLNGIECRENPADRRLYKEGHVELFEDVDETPRRSDLVSRGAAAVLDLVTENVVAKEPELAFSGNAPEVAFTLSSGGYGQRTDENAAADDVDFTLQFALDFNSPGEVRTARAAGDSLVRVEIPLKDGSLDLSARGVSKAVQQIENMLPEDYLRGEPFGVNLAGHGMYRLKGYGSQEDFDVFMAAVALEMKRRGMVVTQWVCGGQTGVDETAVAAARATGAPVRVHGPADWRFRDLDNRDVKGDEAAFKARFDKDYAAIVRKAEAKLPRRERSREAVKTMHV